MRYYEGHISNRVGRIRRDIEDMKLLSPNPEENHSILAIFRKSPSKFIKTPGIFSKKTNFLIYL